MADEAAEQDTGAAGESDEQECPPLKCPDCPLGLPGWMATFSDLVTLLLTFFVLLLSFSKTESAKYEAALGSLRKAFGGNVLQHGEVIQRGKSPDNAPTMVESQEPIKPFPIDFLTMEGMLDKHEINRESDEDLDEMKRDLKEYNLEDSATIYEMPEGIKVKIKDKIFFKKGSLEISSSKVTVAVYEKLVQMLKDKKWTIFVQGHAQRGEVSRDGNNDAFILSSARAAAVTRSLIRRGVRPETVTTVFYGDSRPVDIPNRSLSENQAASRRVDFILRKVDLNKEGHAVDAK